MAIETRDAEATRQLRRHETRYVLRIRLDDGEEIRADTSEFVTFAVIAVALTIAMARSTTSNADRGWLLITVIGVAYMIARGRARSGTRDPNPNQREGREYR
jgi:hypothetical protein